MKVITFAAVATLALAVMVAPKPALARDGAVAAGVVGGLAVGAIVGSQMNRDRDYRESYRACHMERQEVTDRYGNYRVVRVRVCD